MTRTTEMNNIIEDIYTEISTLEGNTHSVMCLAIHENKLYYGGQDKTIRVWKI